ncbi:MAG: 2-amino-4-hydroxy-6-hydroxymethyldihydropteridine diphosphokinase, partial [Victivallaceae bacterium]
MIGDKHKIQRVILALGGNLGLVEDKFRFAIRNLGRGAFDVVGRSSVYITRPVDCEPDEADFLNMVISGFYSGTPEELLHLVKDIEVAAGRPAIHGVNTARSLDIDIIFFGDEVVESPELIIPHPRWKERLFVLVPLAEL